MKLLFLFQGRSWRKTAIHIQIVCSALSHGITSPTYSLMVAVKVEFDLFRETINQVLDVRKKIFVEVLIGTERDPSLSSFLPCNFVIMPKIADKRETVFRMSIKWHPLEGATYVKT